MVCWGGGWCAGEGEGVLETGRVRATTAVMPRSMPGNAYLVQ